MFNAGLYLKKKYEIKYVFDAENIDDISDNKGILLLKYKDDINEGVYVEKEDSGLYSITPIGNNTKNIKYKFGKHEAKDINTNIYSLYKRYEPIKILPNHKSEFNMILGDNAKKINIEFDFRNKVIYDAEYKICMSYESDLKLQCLDGTKLIETFWFTDTGYYYENKSENDYSAYINEDIQASFNMDSYSNIFNIDILTKIPNMINYNNGVEYRVFYDKYGIPKQYIDTSNQLIDLVKYQLEDRNGTVIISLHPLLYDAFDYRYIDKPLKYWAIDTLLINSIKDIRYHECVFSRVVGEIKDDNALAELLKFISTPESLI